MQWGHYASDYDGVIAGHVARRTHRRQPLPPPMGPEEHLLKLEKQAFLELLKQEKTHERIEALLTTGKPEELAGVSGLDSLQEKPERLKASDQCEKP